MPDLNVLLSKSELVDSPAFCHFKHLSNNYSVRLALG